MYEAWINRFDGYDHNDDLPSALLLDGNGNLFVTGNTRSTATGIDFLTIKYSPQGAVLWQAIYNGQTNGHDWPRNLALDQSGNLYVSGGIGTGVTDYVYGLIKYDPSGDTLWVRVLPRQPGFVLDMALDNAGNIYLTGPSGTLKFDPNGNQVWFSSQTGRRMAWHDSGFVYLTAWDLYDLPQGVTKKLSDSSGGLIWQYNAGGTDLELDNSGNIYVTGVYNNSYRTIKFSPSGTPLWTRFYSGADDGVWGSQSKAVGIDASGQPVVTGWSYSGTVGNDFATIKYPANGESLWTSRLDGPAQGNDEAGKIVLGNSGKAFVHGFNTGNFSNYDYTTAKYNSSGQQLWVMRYSNAGEDRAEDLAVDNTGNVYVPAFSQAPHYLVDWVTIKYSPCTPSVPVLGDANADLTISLADIIATVNYIFNKPGFPACTSNSNFCWISESICRGDWNADQTVTLTDVVRSVNYLMNRPGGPWNPKSIVGCCLP